MARVVKILLRRAARFIRCRQFLFQLAQTIALPEAARRCGRGAGLDGKAIPTPHGTVFADQSLTRMELALQGGAAALHHANLGQAPGQGSWAAYILGQWRGAAG